MSPFKADLLIRYLSDAIDYMDFAQDRAASNIRRVISWLEAERDGEEQEEDSGTYQEGY